MYYRKCKIEDCNNDIKCLGLCKKHHQRYLRHGSPHISLKERHGQRYTKTYASWLGIRQRCKNKNNNDYNLYGGRGITVCKRWKKFSTFLEDMGHTPSKHTIDRIDNNGNYNKNNCRWATQKTQVRNSRLSTIIKHNGKQMCISAWAEYLSINYSTLRTRLNNWSVDKALTTPVRKA